MLSLALSLIIAQAVAGGGGGSPDAPPHTAGSARRPPHPAPPLCDGSRILVPTRAPFTGAPPTAMPSALEWAYTRCGAVPMSSGYYVDDTQGGAGLHISVRAGGWPPLLEAARKIAAMASPAAVLGKQGWVAEAMLRMRSVIANASVL